VGKYAEATQVEISVRDYSNHVEVEIRDNGRASTCAHPPSTHGLAGMRHRVEAAGGRLTVSSQPGMARASSPRCQSAAAAPPAPAAPQRTGLRRCARPRVVGRPTPPASA
jgi:signal transduction histidine kinase